MSGVYRRGAWLAIAGRAERCRTGAALVPTVTSSAECSREHLPDCVQVVIALIDTPEGFPLTYEVLAGKSADAMTLPQFLEHIVTLYGKARRIWVMNRGIPTETHLALMRERGAQYLVGTPKGRLTRLEAEPAACSWQQAHERLPHHPQGRTPHSVLINAQIELPRS
jgi:hypothetical protein